MLSGAEIHWRVLVGERWTVGYHGARECLDLADFPTGPILAIIVEH